MRKLLLTPLSAEGRMVNDAQNNAIAIVNLAMPAEQAHTIARMLAAAPDMYAALMAILPWIPPAHAKMSMVASSKQLDAANAVRAALAKAST